MRGKLAFSEWSLWLKWALAFAIAWVVGRAVASILTWLYFYSAFTALEELLRSSILGATFGAFLGLPTALVVKLRRKQLILWIVSMMVACGFSVFVVNATSRIWQTSALYPSLSGILFGLSTGVAQWMILKCRVRHAIWFLVANVASWIVAQGLPIAELGGVVIGLVTGFVLVLLMRYPITAPAMEQLGYLSTRNPS